MRRAVAISADLGDAVVGCGATLSGLAAGGWHVTLVTAFAAPDPHASAEDAAALAARREADHAAAAALGLAGVVHLALAAVPVADERATARLAAALDPVLAAAQPERVFAPLGASAGAAHLLTLGALRWLDHPAPVVRYREAVHGRPAALPDEHGIPVARTLERKLAACAAYGAPPAGEVEQVALAEGRRLGVDGPAEALVEPARDTKKRRPGSEEEDDKAALVRALRGAIGLAR